MHRSSTMYYVHVHVHRDMYVPIWTRREEEKRTKVTRPTGPLLLDRLSLIIALSGRGRESACQGRERAQSAEHRAQGIKDDAGSIEMQSPERRSITIYVQEYW